MHLINKLPKLELLDISGNLVVTGYYKTVLDAEEICKACSFNDSLPTLEFVVAGNVYIRIGLY